MEEEQINIDLLKSERHNVLRTLLTEFFQVISILLGIIYIERRSQRQKQNRLRQDYASREGRMQQI